MTIFVSLNLYRHFIVYFILKVFSWKCFHFGWLCFLFSCEFCNGC